jgi:hypothetical protein
MLGKIARLFRSGAPEQALFHPSLQQIVDIVGNGINETPDFGATMLPAIESAFSYFERQISPIPGPHPVSTGLMHNGHLCAHLFPGPEDIVRAIGRSLAVKDMLPELMQSGQEEFHALLGMRQRPGQESSVFTDHTLRSLAATPEEVRDQLKQAAFERLLKEFAEHINTLRRKERLLSIEWEWNQRHDVSRTFENTDRPEFVYAAEELTPQKLQQGLIYRLNSPQRYLHIEGGHGHATIVHPGELPVLHSSDRRQWHVCLVTVSMQEAIKAQAQETHTHRYLFI